MIKLKNVFLKLNREYFALYDINLEVNKGEKVAVVGGDQSGKTMLFSLLTKLERATRGDIYIKDTLIDKINFEFDVSMGYLPTKNIFFENKTVKQNLEYILKERKIKKEEIDGIISNKLTEFNFSNYSEHKVKELTEFEKTILSIIRLSLRDLEILLIDSIFENYNSKENEKLIKIINNNLIKPETTVLLATKNEDIAKLFNCKIIKINSGSLED